MTYIGREAAIDIADERTSAKRQSCPKPDEVDGSRSRPLSAKMGCCHANPSKGAIRHGY